MSNKTTTFYNSKTKKSRRIYKNIAEEEFCQFIEKLGYTPMKRGWPDFFCYDKKAKRYICVEVKPERRHPLKKEQTHVCKVLSFHGIPTFRWDLENRVLQQINKFGQLVKNS